MTDSSETAKRFLALRAARELRIIKTHDSAKMRDYSTQPKAARIKGPKKTSTKPSPANPWAYIERHQAGAQEAWGRDVNLPIEGFTLAMSIKGPLALDKRCYDPASIHTCQCRAFEDGKWDQRHCTNRK